MNELRTMLTEKYPNIDFDTEKNLVTSGTLDSLEVVAIIAALEDLFDISITMEYIQPVYFESIEAMWEMVQELQ